MEIIIKVNIAINISYCLEYKCYLNTIDYHYYCQLIIMVISLYCIFKLQYILFTIQYKNIVYTILRTIHFRVQFQHIFIYIISFFLFEIYSPFFLFIYFRTCILTFCEQFHRSPNNPRCGCICCFITASKRFHHRIN